MAKQTPNLGFTKPDVNEFYDVQVQNENWDKVDEQLKKFIVNITKTVTNGNTTYVADKTYNEILAACNSEKTCYLKNDNAIYELSRIVLQSNMKIMQFTCVYSKTISSFAIYPNNNIVKTSTDLETEQWTFTLEDGSTVTKAVYVG